MHSGRRSPITPSMAVALTGLGVALGGTAFATSGAFESAEGTVQACVTQTNIVRAATDILDEATGKAVAPATQGVSGLVDGTKVLTPKGTLIAVSRGEKCPAGSTPQSLAAPSPSMFVNGKPKALGDGKTTLASLELPSGSYTVNAVAKVSMIGESGVIHTIKCALVGADGKTIAGTTSQATIQTNSPDERVTIPILAQLTDVSAGTLTGICKDSAPAEKGRSGARSAGTPDDPEMRAEMDADIAHIEKQLDRSFSNGEG